MTAASDPECRAPAAESRGLDDAAIVADLDAAKTADVETGEPAAKRPASTVAPAFEADMTGAQTLDRRRAAGASGR